MSTVERDNEAAAPPVDDVTTIVTRSGDKPASPSAALTASGNEEQKDDGREYVVLRAVPPLKSDNEAKSVGEWHFVASIEATSAQQAVRKAAETPGTSFLDPEGTVVLVAIPSRSFNPISVTVKTETTIVLS